MTTLATAPTAQPWQLQLYRKSLKKQQKIKLLLELLGPLGDKRCLLVTNGDNNGAMNLILRNAGGRWTWAEMEEGGIPAMVALLDEPVVHASSERLPFDDAAFDRVIVIDVHEHLASVTGLNREIGRVLAGGGLAVVTTPNGTAWLPVALLKRLFGMHPRNYGHVVQGYTAAELERMLREVGLIPEQRGAYSRFFTELAEFAINFGYVKILARRKRGPRVETGTIAPASADQLRAVERTYRMYAMIYPFVRAFSTLDTIVPGRGGYAVAVTARKAR
ncbi:MAG TPA: methyltransferase domain-containing protein [Gemmatimonadales bacterium]|nr:methyltransferase domain-containing protein [Gemmatimonadales bacterium]